MKKNLLTAIAAVALSCSASAQPVLPAYSVAGNPTPVPATESTISLAQLQSLLVTQGGGNIPISGTPAAGYVPIATSPTAAAWGNNFPGPFTATGAALTGVPGFSGPVGLSMIASMSGNSGSNNYSPFVIDIQDSVVSTGYVYPLVVFNELNSTSVSGGRPGLTGDTVMSVPTSPTNPLRFYAGVSGVFDALVADNGINGAVLGVGYGVSGNCTMGASAAHWGGCIGIDSAVNILTGATDIQRRIGFVAEGDGNLQGTTIDAAYDILAPTVAWKIGLLFDDAANIQPVAGGPYPISAGGTMIQGAFSPTVNIALRAGLDLSEITGAWTLDAIMLPQNNGGISWGTQSAAGGGGRIYSTATANGAQINLGPKLATIVSAGIGTTGNISQTAWTTNGLRYRNSPATYTDTNSSGTVTAAYTDLFAASTIAASNATTYTTYYGSYFVNPVASTNVTMTNKYAIGADSIETTTLNVGGNTWQVNVATGNLQFLNGATIEALIDSSGNIRANLGYYSSGAQGLSATTTVRAAGGAADCTLIFTGGLKTGGTC